MIESAGALRRARSASGSSSAVLIRDLSRFSLVKVDQGNNTICRCTGWSRP